MNEYFWLFVWLFEAFLFLFILNVKKKMDIFKPINMLILFMVFSSMVSYLGYKVLAFYGFWRQNANFEFAFQLYTVAGFFLLTGYYLVSPMSKIVKRSKRKLNIKRLDKSCDIILTVNVVSFVAFYGIFFGFQFPMLSILPDQVRFEIIAHPMSFILTRFLYPASVILGFKLTTIKLLWSHRSKNKKILDSLLVAITFILFVLHGSKMRFITPVVIYILNYNTFIRKVRIKDLLRLKYVIVIVMAIFLLAEYTHLRGGLETYKKISKQPLPVSFFRVLLPPFRTMAALLDSPPYIQTLDAIWISAIPNEVFGFLGYSKELYKSKLRDTLLDIKEINLGSRFVGGTARFGIIGELFFNGGYPCLIIGMIIYGIIFALLQRYANSKSFGAMIANALTWSLVWLIVSELPNNLPMFYLQFYFLILLGFIVSAPKIKRKTR